MNRRARKRKARHDEILDAAMAIVRADGLDGLTIAGLARDLDAAVGAIYRYFEGKSALLAGLQLRAVEGLDAALVELESATQAAQGEAGPRALARVLAFPLGYLHDARRAEHRLIDEVLSDPEPLFDDALAGQTEAALAPLLARCEEALQAAVDAGSLDPAPPLPRAHGLWALAHGLEHFRKRDRLVEAPLRADALAESLLVSLLQGWGAKRADIQTALRIVRTCLPTAERP